jgi:hypothetical protein
LLVWVIGTRVPEKPMFVNGSLWSGGMVFNTLVRLPWQRSGSGGDSLCVYHTTFCQTDKPPEGGV